MTISVGAENEVKHYLGSANNRAYNALEDAIDSLSSTALWDRVNYTSVNANSVRAIRVPTHSLNPSTPLAIPTVAKYKESNESSIDNISVIKGVEYSGAPRPIGTTQLPSMPNPTLPASPGNAPILNSPVMPTVPALKTISDPVTFPLIIPAKPITNVIDFDKTAPVYQGVDVPNNSFHWTEDAYTSDLLTQTKIVIEDMLSGTTGIPDVIWDAIWQRDEDKENKAAVKLLKESRASFASLGFTLPTGVQAARELEIQTAVYETSSSRARDIAIKQAEHETENLKVAVTNGITMETLVSSLYDKSLNRLLEATKYAVQSSIDIFNASATMYELELKAFATEIEIIRIQLESEITKMEIYKSEIMALAEIGKLNKIELDIFVAKYDALKVQVDLYNSEVQAAKVFTEAENLKMVGFETEVKAYATMVQAALSEYEGFKAASQGLAAQAQVLSANTDLFAKKISSVNSDTQNNIAIAELKVKKENTKLELIAKDIGLFTAKISNFGEELKGNIAVISEELKNRSVEYGRLNSVDQSVLGDYRVRLDDARFRTDTLLKNAMADLEAAIHLSKTGADILTTRASINSDIGNAAMSAVNVHAGITDSASNSFEVASS